LNHADYISETTVEEMPTRVASVKIREARVDDYAQITAVQRRNGLGAKNEDEWRHLWLDNPAYKMRPGWPMGWVAETTAGEIVGYMGNIPSAYSFHGEDLSSTCTFAMVVDPAHAGYAGFLGKRFICQKNVDVLLVTSANPNSARLVAPLHGKRVPSGDWNHSVYWITNYRGFAASAFAMKKWPRLASVAAAAAMAARDKLNSGGFRAAKSEIPLHECPGFDARFDKFWEGLKSAYPDRLLGYRTSEVLRWHFKYALQQKNLWILTAGTESKISAYAIFYRLDNRRLGLKRVRLVDFQTLEGNSEALAPMLRLAYERCRKENIHMLEACGFRPDKEAVIEAANPHRRELPSWFYYYFSRRKDLAPTLENPDIWDPCHFDGDSSL
jgi:hypothetical protein